MWLSWSALNTIILVAGEREAVAQEDALGTLPPAGRPLPAGCPLPGALAVTSLPPRSRAPLRSCYDKLPGSDAYRSPHVTNGAPWSLPRSSYVAGCGCRACLQTSTCTPAHSRWACPRTVQASLAMMTMLSAGLCLAEAQQITLLATGARPPTLLLTR